MRRVIINADDLGASQGTNEAIAKAFRDGILTSASVMLTMPGYHDAIHNVIPNAPGLGVGLHFSLTEGKSVLDKSEIPLLVDERGYFYRNFMDLCLVLKLRRSTDLLVQISKELDSQCEKFYWDVGRMDHINAHRHVHMIPPIFNIVVRLAKKYACPAVRISNERLADASGGWYAGINGNIMKNIVLNTFAKHNRKIVRDIFVPDHFFGVLHSGGMDIRVIKHIFDVLKPGVTEILTHPGLYNSPEWDESGNGKMRKWMQSKGRMVELEALIDNSLRKEIVKKGILLTRFSDVLA